jgi:hypothetical protein
MPPRNTWTHIILKYDSTQSDPNNRFSCYYNNILQINNYSSNVRLNQILYQFTNSMTFTLGTGYGFQYFGYLSQFIFVDNQALTPSSFGTLVNNTWVAKKYIGSFGPNGWYLDFSNLNNPGLDVSGNNNNWTSNNITSANIITTNICPQVYFPNTSLIIKSNFNLPLNAFNITYTVSDNSGGIISINRWLNIVTNYPIYNIPYSTDYISTKYNVSFITNGISGTFPLQWAIKASYLSSIGIIYNSLWSIAFKGTISGYGPGSYFFVYFDFGNGSFPNKNVQMTTSNGLQQVGFDSNGCKLLPTNTYYFIVSNSTYLNVSVYTTTGTQILNSNSLNPYTYTNSSTNLFNIYAEDNWTFTSKILISPFILLQYSDCFNAFN